MNETAILSPERRALRFTETSVETGIVGPIIEKDFWVCWMLGLLFGEPEWAGALVFKGGTALSKVFGAIQRFSEDIDLSLAPSLLGLDEAEMERALSRRQRARWMETLEQRCADWIGDQMRPALEAKTASILGSRPGGQPWLELIQDAVSQSPVLYFHYPTAMSAGADYIRRAVKLEFGSLTDQRPTGRHMVRPWLAELLPAVGGCEVVALELERAFWEKATILHAEHHRVADSPMPDRYSRHYADLAALAGRPEAAAAVGDGALRQRVVDWKAKFFARSWARYDLAAPGSFRLLPPDSRRAELARDYKEMRQMFIGEPMAFEAVMAALAGLEARINAEGR